MIQLNFQMFVILPLFMMNYTWLYPVSGVLHQQPTDPEEQELLLAAVFVNLPLFMMYYTWLYPVSGVLHQQPTDPEEQELLLVTVFVILPPCYDVLYMVISCVRCPTPTAHWPWGAGAAACRSVCRVPPPRWSRRCREQELSGTRSACYRWSSRWRCPAAHVVAVDQIKNASMK